jgi:hypothetical protein
VTSSQWPLKYSLGCTLEAASAEWLQRTIQEISSTAFRLAIGSSATLLMDKVCATRPLGFQEIAPSYEAPPELHNHLIFMEAPLAGYPL